MTDIEIGSIWKVKWASKEYERDNFVTFLVLQSVSRHEILGNGQLCLCNNGKITLHYIQNNSGYERIG